MKRFFPKSKDFWAGLMFLGFGLVAVVIARGYPFGSAARIGPGYFPSLLGGLLVLFGLFLLVRGAKSKDEIEGPLSLRALLVLPAALVIYGIFMERLGFIPALAALIFAAAASGREFKFREVLLLTVILCLISVAMFIWGLGLPYPLFKSL